NGVQISCARAQSEISFIAAIGFIMLVECGQNFKIEVARGFMKGSDTRKKFDCFHCVSWNLLCGRILLIVDRTTNCKETVAGNRMATWEELKDSALNATAAGNFGAAEKAWHSAREEAERMGANSPELATSMLGLAQVYNAMGNFPEGQKWAEKATALREEI